ncbi:oxygenase MpaB family protein [Sphingobacterium hungaricum]
METVPFRYRQNTSSFAHYWTEGIGKELLENLGFQPDIKNADQFVPYLFKWDNPADQVVFDLYQKIGFPNGNRALSNYISKKYVDSDEKKAFDQLFDSFTIEPDWVDFSRIRKGAELSRRAGISALIVLRDYCLMGGYESSAINKPLIYTGALKKGAVKRLTDTVEFWVQITKEDALRNHAEGFKQVMMTRMIHAYSRVNILQHSDWDSHKWGIPINQWDLLATQLGFSLVFLVGLRRMGFQPSEEEIDGLFHKWKYIGYLLGIPLELLPETEAEAIEALYYWTMTQANGDADSKALAKALQNEPLEANYPKNELMRKFMREVHLYYNYYLLGDYSCNLLELPKTTVGKLAIVNIWKYKKLEKNMHLDEVRQKAILDGGNEQENVRVIYQTFNK